MIIDHFLKILILIFAIEDLIGKKKTKAIETKWLSLSARILSTWKTKTEDINAWLPKIIRIAFVQLFVAILLSPALTIFFASEKVKQAPWWQFMLGAIPVMTGMFIYYSHVMYLEKIVKTEELPMELRLSLKLKDWFYGFLGHAAKAKGPKGGAGLVLIILVIIGAVMTFVVSTVSLLVRIMAFSFVIIMWFIFFAPARFLASAAKRLGADGYLKVGKYILLVLAYIVSWFYRTTQ